MTCEDGGVENPPGDRPRLPRRVGESLTRLARVTGELSRADTVDAVTKIVTYHMADAVGATIAALALREGDRARLIGLRGLSAGEAQRWDTIPLARRSPATDVIRSGRRLVLVGGRRDQRGLPRPARASTEANAPSSTSPCASPGARSARSPCRSPGRSLPDPDRARLPRHHGRHLRPGLRAHRGVRGGPPSRPRGWSSSPRPPSSWRAASTSRSRSTGWPDWPCPPSPTGAPSTSCATGGCTGWPSPTSTPEKVELAVALQERWPPDPSSPSGARAVALTGTPELIHEITDEMLVAGCRDAEQLRIARELRLRSALLVPLWVRGRVIGVLSWVSTDDDRLYDEDDVRFAEHLARRAATAIDNSELYSQTRAAAEQLQHAVLPQALVGDDRWDVSCHYRPSGRAEIGGDFYDAFPLDDGRYVAFIGDVMGRGVAAAAAMAEMRAATRAFASVDPDPAAVLRQARPRWSCATAATSS